MSAASSDTERAQQLVVAINAVSAQSGVGATFDGTNIKLTGSGAINWTGVATTSGFGTGSIGASVTTGAIGATHLQTYTHSQLAIGMVDAALTSVNSSRATIGAINSRFDSVIANLRSTTENLSASRSRIQDTDFAAETARLTRSQVLQQAGVAMLAQANAAPQQVLSLLR
jgi:flagellin